MRSDRAERSPAQGDNKRQRQQQQEREKSQVREFKKQQEKK